MNTAIAICSTDYHNAAMITKPKGNGWQLYPMSEENMCGMGEYEYPLNNAIYERVIAACGGFTIHEGSAFVFCFTGKTWKVLSIRTTQNKMDEILWMRNEFHSVAEALSYYNINLEGYEISDSLQWDSQDWKEVFILASDSRDKDTLHKLRQEVFTTTKQYLYAGGYSPQRMGEWHPLSVRGEFTLLTQIYKKPIQVHRPHFEVDTQISVVHSDCLIEAQKHIEIGKRVAVLNMASASHPGGGVETGAGAQEENLCRRSNLFFALSDVKRYAYPLDAHHGGIYSPGICVFRDSEDAGYALLEQPWKIDVITVAAPRIGKEEISIALTPDGTNYQDKNIEQTMIDSIRTILNIAIDNSVSVLVLSAFGCGAFHNPPQRVAELFKQELNSDPYRGQFSKVVFAIIDDHNARVSNVAAFKKVFEKE